MPLPPSNRLADDRVLGHGRAVSILIDKDIRRSRRFSVAPMMEWTDRHCRFFHRLLTRRTLLYTEMLTTGAVLHGDRARLLRYDPAEHPLALQLGGADPRALAALRRHRGDLGVGDRTVTR